MLTTIKRIAKFVVPKRLHPFISNILVSKLAGHAMKYYSILKKNPSMPVYADISPVYRCNYRCYFCQTHSYKLPKGQYHDDKNNEYYSEFKKDKSNFFLDINVYKKLVDDMASLNFDMVILSGVGEPLLHPDILEMVRYARTKKLYVCMVTNGTLFTKDIIDELYKADLSQIIVSLNALSPETYTETHGIKKAALLDHIVEHLGYIHKINVDKKINVNLSFVVSKLNYHEIPDYHTLGQKYDYGVQYKPYATKFPTEYTMDEALVDSIVKQLTDLNKKDNSLFKELWYELNINNKVVDFPCTGSDMVFVSSNGDVFPCTESKVILGNLTKEPFQKIIHNDIYKKFRKDALFFFKKKNPYCDCENCYMLSFQKKEFKSFAPFFKKFIARGKN